MKTPPSPVTEPVEFEDWEAADQDDLKEISFPDDPSGEIFFQVHSRLAFESAGYRVRRAGKADTHAVFIVHLTRTTAQHMSDDARFFQHVQQLLSDHRIKLKKADLSVSRTGNNILVAFMMEPPANRKSKQK